MVRNLLYIFLYTHTIYTYIYIYTGCAILPYLVTSGSYLGVVCQGQMSPTSPVPSHSWGTEESLVMCGQTLKVSPPVMLGRRQKSWNLKTSTARRISRVCHGFLLILFSKCPSVSPVNFPPGRPQWNVPYFWLINNVKRIFLIKVDSNCWVRGEGEGQ